MPSRRRNVTGKKLMATAEPAVTSEEKPMEESHPVVTQVVEVVGDEPPVQEPDVVERPIEPTEESEIRKEKVEELYQGVKESTVMPEISIHKNKPFTPILVWAVVTIFVAVLTGVVLFFTAKKTSPMKLFTRPTPQPKADQPLAGTPTPTPTPKAIDKTSFKIQVLNGGGTVGAAGKMKTALEDNGYTVSGTGNADEYTYTATEIHGKSTMVDAIAHLQADLKGTYTLGTVAADLPASSSADVQVIVGK